MYTLLLVNFSGILDILELHEIIHFSCVLPDTVQLTALCLPAKYTYLCSIHHTPPHISIKAVK